MTLFDLKLPVLNISPLNCWIFTAQISRFSGHLTGLEKLPVDLSYLRLIGSKFVNLSILIKNPILNPYQYVLNQSSFAAEVTDYSKDFFYQKHVSLFFKVISFLCYISYKRSKRKQQWLIYKPISIQKFEQNKSINKINKNKTKQIMIIENC